MTAEMDNRAAKPERDDKKKPRRTGQREEVAKGKHQIRVFLGRDTVTGKRHYHSETFFGGARQAEERIREIIRRHRAGEPIKANADTFDAFLDEWIESKKLSVEESSLKTYREKVDWYVRPTLGPKLLASVKAGDVQKLYGKLREDGLSRGTIHDVHIILNMIFKLAVKRQKLNGSPMAGVEFPKDWIEDEGEDKERAMTPDQVARFLEAAEGSRFDNLFRLAFHIGCRPGELLALKWADLDTGTKTLRVNQSIVWRNSQDWYLKKPKTKLSRRTLPLTDALIDLLASQRKRQLETRLKAGKLWTDHGFIFADPLGEPYRQGTLRNDVKKVLKAAGLPEGFTTYSARHTMATLLIATGTNPKAVSERLGHSGISITLQTYTHVSPGMQSAVSEEIERLLSGQK